MIMNKFSVSQLHKNINISNYYYHYYIKIYTGERGANYYSEVLLR